MNDSKEKTYTDDNADGPMTGPQYSYGYRAASGEETLCVHCNHHVTGNCHWFDVAVRADHTCDCVKADKDGKPEELLPVAEAAETPVAANPPAPSVTKEIQAEPRPKPIEWEPLIRAAFHGAFYPVLGIRKASSSDSMEDKLRARGMEVIAAPDKPGRSTIFRMNQELALGNLVITPIKPSGIPDTQTICDQLISYLYGEFGQSARSLMKPLPECGHFNANLVKDQSGTYYCVACEDRRLILQELGMLLGAASSLVDRINKSGLAIKASDEVKFISALLERRAKVSEAARAPQEAKDDAAVQVAGPTPGKDIRGDEDAAATDGKPTESGTTGDGSAI